MTPVRDERGRIVALPALERTARQAFEAMRTFQSRRRSRELVSTTTGSARVRESLFSLRSTSRPSIFGSFRSSSTMAGGPPVRPLDRFYTLIRDGQVLVGPRYSVNNELRRFAPRDPGEPLDGIGQFLYPARPSTPPAPHGRPSGAFPFVFDHCFPEFE